MTATCGGVTGGRSRFLFRGRDGFGGPHRQCYLTVLAVRLRYQKKKKKESGPVFFFDRAISISNRNRTWQKRLTNSRFAAHEILRLSLFFG